MKKSIFLSFFISLFPLFAAEITIISGAGMSVYAIHGNNETAISGSSEKTVSSADSAFCLIPAPSIGLDLHFTRVAHKKDGFTFSLINNASLPIAFYKRGGFGDNSQHVTGYIWDGQMLIGYTYGVRRPLSIRSGIGLGLTVGRFWIAQNSRKLENGYIAFTPVAVHFGVQYIFTEHIGITVDIYDLPGFSYMVFSDGQGNRREIEGVGNIFTLRIAAAFRF